MDANLCVYVCRARLTIHVAGKLFSYATSQRVVDFRFSWEYRRATQRLPSSSKLQYYDTFGNRAHLEYGYSWFRRHAIQSIFWLRYARLHRFLAGPQSSRLVISPSIQSCSLSARSSTFSNFAATSFERGNPSRRCTISGISCSKSSLQEHVNSFTVMALFRLQGRKSYRSFCQRFSRESLALGRMVSTSIPEGSVTWKVALL